MRVHLDALARAWGLVVSAVTVTPAALRRHVFRTLALSLCLLVGNVWAGSASYYYDELGRLIETVAADGTSVLYSYDAVGNITSVKHDAASTVGISGFIPASGPVGTSVTIFGSGFNTTAVSNVVKFNGVAATVTAATATTLSVSVPSGATTGLITVTNGAASATSSSNFTVASSGAPTIAGFTPTIGNQGTAVTLTGTNFQTALQTDKVLFGIMAAAATSSTATTLATSVPSSAASGKISVTTPFGVATSTADFFAVPDGFTAANVQVTGRVTIGGAPFSGSTTTAGNIGLILFDGVVGSSEYLQLTNVTTAGGSVNVYGPDGSLLASGAMANGVVSLPTIPVTATYTVMVAPSAATSLSVAVKQAATLAVDGAGAAITSVGTGYGTFLTFNGTAGQNLGLELTGVTFSGNSGTVSVTAYAPNGLYLMQASCSQSNPNGACNVPLWNLPQTGPYKIAVSNPGSPATTGGVFTLSSDKTATLTSGTAYALSLHAGQNGRLTFAGTAGQATVLSLTNIATTPASQRVLLTVLKPDGSTLTTLGGWTANATEWNTPSTGTYTVLVNEDYGLASTMSVLVSPPPTVAVDGAAVNMPSVAMGGSTFLAFDGTAGQNLGLELTGTTFSGGSGDVYVEVNAPDGSYVGETTCSQSNPNGACNVPMSNLLQTGRYTVLVSNPESPATTGGVLTLSSDKTATLTSGTAYALSLHAGQNGRLTFAGTAGQATVLSLTNIATTPASQNVLLRVLKPDGSTLKTLSGTTAIATEWNMQTGPYTVLVNEDYGLASTMSVLISPPLTVAVDGAAFNMPSIATGSSTFLTFDGTAGQNLGLALTGLTSSGSSGYANVYVVAPDGSVLGGISCVSASTPIGACNLPLTNLQQTGRYTIGVSNQYPSATTGGTLTLKSDKTATLTSGTSYALSLPAGQNGLLTFAGTAASHSLTVGALTTVPASQAVFVSVLDAVDNTVASGSFSATGGVLALGTLSTGSYRILVNTQYVAAANVTLTYQ